MVFKACSEAMASGDVNSRFPILVEDGAAVRAQMQQPAVHNLVPGSATAGHTVDALNIFRDVGRGFEHIVVGNRHVKPVFFENVGAVSHDAGLGAKGQSVQRLGRAGQVGVGAADDAAGLGPGSHQIIGIVAGIGQRGIDEEIRQRLKVAVDDVFRLGEDDPGDHIIFACARLLQFDFLRRFHRLILQEIDLNIDAGLFLKLRDKGCCLLEVIERWPTDDDRIAAVGGVGVKGILRLRRVAEYRRHQQDDKY